VIEMLGFGVGIWLVMLLGCPSSVFSIWTPVALVAGLVGFNVAAWLTDCQY
jgi:hypothetical protein